MKKNILLIGVGGTGSNAVDTFDKLHKTLGNQTDNKITALVFDTDAGDLKKITCAKTVVMSDPASVGTICDRLGREQLRKWFPVDKNDVRSQEMVRGASQWRKKSYLAFLNLMNKQAERSVFISALEDMVQDPGASCEIYVIASVAGGTGSGSFIPIALYAKRYLRKALGKDPIVNAMIALPDIYADSQTPENRVKVYSNAYAILRELNAINLVARDYNAAQSTKKKAPIRFKIGDEMDANVGVLFDASDPRYWTPQAAPFSQVFLLDRIPGLKSIAAHDMVLANSLYTILCTEIGSAFDSEFSNHELVRSQNNGSNAIYAGISTSQVRFPKDTVLEYLACKKTLDSCNGEWLTLHQSVENTIAEKEREAKALHRTFIMEDDEYASLVLKTLEDKLGEDCEDLVAIVERGVDRYDEKGERLSETAGALFADEVEEFITSRVPSSASLAAELNVIFPKGQQNAEYTKDEVTDAAKRSLKILDKFYRRTFDVVRSAPTSTADAILTLDKKKIGNVGEKHSLAKRLLEGKKDQQIHPVAALVRLCQFRVALSEKMAVEPTEWTELKSRNAPKIPERFVTGLDEKGSRSKSAYLRLGKTRFQLISNEAQPSEDYDLAKTNATLDHASLQADVEYIAECIASEALAQVSAAVYRNLARDVDLLIAKYRSFFNRFGKEKELLDELTKDAYRKDAGSVDSVINVYSTEADKDAIMNRVNEGNGPVTQAEIAATDDIVGRGVYSSVFNSAVSERSRDGKFNEKDASAYRSLFSSMIDAYRKSIGGSEIFANIASCNAIEAIVESCGHGATPKELEDAFRAAFSVAQEFASPSLRLDPNTNDIDLVEPSHIMVFMMSENTARYIKRNAEKFELTLPMGEGSDKTVLKACAEQFVRKYSGNNSARVAIENSVPDQVLYCTGEIMDITPLRIAKFNELGEDCVYFKNYTDALNRFKKYGTDMWSPHIGYGLEKRGCLPYMNPDKERDCDEKMVKALLYALKSGTVSVRKLPGSTQYYFCRDGARIQDAQGNMIGNKNISKLLNWLRNCDEEIEKWSAAFDLMIQEQMNLLPVAIGEQEYATLEARITTSDFMRSLNECLYEDSEEKDAKIRVNSQSLQREYKCRTKSIEVKGNEYTWIPKCGPTAVELAWLIKESEEADRDCDDAERILRILYKVFVEIIEFRANRKSAPEQFIKIYQQQLEKFYAGLAASEVVCGRLENCEACFNNIVEWLSSVGVFQDIPRTMPYDAQNNIQINATFDYKNSAKVSSILKFVKYTEPIKSELIDKRADKPAEEKPAEEKPAT